MQRKQAVELGIQRYLDHPEAADAALRAALDACDDPRAAAWQLAEQVGHLLQLPDCVIYLYDATRQDLYQAAAWGHKQVAPRLFENPLRLPLGRGIVGACARDAVPVLVCDTQLDSRYVVDVTPRRSELAVPILSSRGLVGVIDCEHALVDAFRSRHLRALVHLANVFVDWVDQRARLG